MGKITMQFFFSLWINFLPVLQQGVFWIASVLPGSKQLHQQLTQAAKSSLCFLSRCFSIPFAAFLPLL